MDYQTKPLSLADIRRLAIVLRRAFEVPESGNFPVLQMLDFISDVFPKSNYLIVEDYELGKDVMAECVQNEQGGYTIKIKESIYDGAYKKQIGAHLGFICHEICHVFLFYIGYTPIITRSFKNGELPAYCSVEWQAKALCAEVMIPFEESREMSESAVMKIYHVSKAFAEMRVKRGLNEKTLKSTKCCVNNR